MGNDCTALTKLYVRNHLFTENLFLVALMYSYASSMIGGYIVDCMSVITPICRKSYLHIAVIKCSSYRSMNCCINCDLFLKSVFHMVIEVELNSFWGQNNQYSCLLVDG